MAKPIKARMTVTNEQELVVFLIGMRVNSVWKVRKWVPVAVAMTRMLKELKQHPEMGFLGAELTLTYPTTLMVQYWRSFEDLAVYAGNKNAFHLPAGGNSIAGLQAMVTWGSGTRPIAFPPDTTRLSTTTCPHLGSEESSLGFPRSGSERALVAVSRQER